MNSIFPISRLFIKKKLKCLSEIEKLHLKKYIKQYPFIKEVDYNYIHASIDNYVDIDQEQAWGALIERIKNVNEKSFYQRIQPIFKYAAIFICFLSLIYFISIRLNLFDSSEQNLDKNAITLTLENGDIQTIISNSDQKINTSHGNLVKIEKNNILTCDKNFKSNRLVYNELNIPFGKRFQVILSDGTKVHLNSGSSLRFPITFVKGHYRKVYLSGEAYFEVTKDKSHPFIVQSEALDVKVLGTKFNVSSYKDEPVIKTVLVEGSVEVFNSNKPNKKSVLVPGEKASWKKNNSQITIEKVDVDYYTAWINGKLIFKNNPFSEIRKKLERKYNVTIINNNLSLEKNTFSAVFDIESIEEVMEVLHRSYGIRYEIKQKQITIY